MEYHVYRLPPIQLMAFKPCTKCREELPATEEYFNRDAQRQQGFTSACRACIKKASREWRERNLDHARDLSRMARHERNARMKGLAYESFNSHEIFERDNWICGICGEPVFRDFQFPHPESATLDHVHPVSRGGTHTRDNTQCSHWKCNAGKGTRVSNGT